ncbi:hypothetical protein [Nesterenkonia xinjiangensis]|uniref:Methyl-accepting chemotaxis protein n=1 Tax=Nesterenkonia xinjiangensis TaxID=225327 RepID=A0A7Z0GJ86_9MICC|nr:hypothetical protein [Nesterenkonia xinjiangensis]NYJ76995.1 methyl-accepting chemotaxis protein [Nesterenkonia xinjiangensis]
MTGTVTEPSNERTQELKPVPDLPAPPQGEQLDPLVVQLLEQHRALLRELQWAYKQLDTFHRLEVEGVLKDLSRSIDEKMADRQLAKQVERLSKDVEKLTRDVKYVKRNTPEQSARITHSARRAVKVAATDPRRAARAAARRLPRPVKDRLKRLSGGAGR